MVATADDFDVLSPQAGKKPARTARWGTKAATTTGAGAACDATAALVLARGARRRRAAFPVECRSFLEVGNFNLINFAFLIVSFVLARQLRAYLL